MSRSATVVIAYLIKWHKMSYEEGFKHVSERRKCIFPNLGFQ